MRWNPSSTFETNVAGTWRLLEACRHSPKVRQVIVASSDKAYGSADRLPYGEETPLRGQHPYDASKSCADLIGQSYALQDVAHAHRDLEARRTVGSTVLIP